MMDQMMLWIWSGLGLYSMGCMGRRLSTVQDAYGKSINFVSFFLGTIDLQNWDPNTHGQGLFFSSLMLHDINAKPFRP
jgi:hypothetical protein